MRALLLAAGLGTRLKPITNHTPKCLVKIGDKPLLSYWFDLLNIPEIEQILINTHHLAEKVDQFINQSDWKSKINVVHEERLLGTGGTILNNHAFFNEESFIVAHADNFTFFDMQGLIMAHRNKPKAVEITMMTFDTDTPESCGIVEINNDNIVIKFHEKVKNPPSNRANAAIYIFEPTIIKFLRELGKDTIDLSAEVLPFFMGKIQTFHNSTYHRDIGTIESLQQANNDFYKKDNLFFSRDIQSDEI